MGRWGAASALESTMQRLTGLLVLTLCTGLFVPNHSFARDDGRFTDTPLRQWFDQLASARGLCCSFADGVSIQDVDWDTRDGIGLSRRASAVTQV
jgi:hypothetical protein